MEKRFYTESLPFRRSDKLKRFMVVFCCIITVSLISWGLMSPFRMPKTVIPNQPDTAQWPGWSEIRHMFIFGDSYSRTGFRLENDQPSPENPLGNPPYPGKTSANGPNWVDFLTTTWNETYVETINFSRGGAVVDKALVPASSPVKALRDQVEDLYQFDYAGHPSFFDWRPQTTLFGIWIGFNDMTNGRRKNKDPLVFEKSIDEYARLVGELYRSGARNFLFLTLPPVERTPMIIAWGSSKVRRVTADVAEWNRNLAKLVQDLEERHPDVTTFTYDIHKLFTEVMDDHTQYEITRPYLNMTDYCRAYQYYTKDWYAKKDSCEHPVDKYFWINKAHPTFRMHNLTAQEIAKTLSRGKPQPWLHSDWLG